MIDGGGVLQSAHPIAQETARMWRMSLLVWAPFLLACGVREFSSSRVDPSVSISGDGSPPGPSVAPSAGVMIGGVLVPRDKVVVFLHIGHSNMAGRASAPAALRPFNYDTDPKLWSYAGGGVWNPAHEPLSGDFMTHDRAGPGMSILHAALALAPDHFMVSIGHGHSGTAGGFCRSYRRGGLLYDQVMARARELQGKVTFGAIFTMLGLSEVDDMPNATHFGECMRAVAAEMRADLGEPDLPFMVGDYEAEVMTELGPTSPIAQIIIPQLHALPMQIPRAALIPTEMLPIIRGDHHYDLTGYKLWAERAFAILKAKGWTRWGK
jgi:hypothetical protein